MKTTLELAKELLRKGRALNDLELIQMANEMLDSVVPTVIVTGTATVMNPSPEVETSTKTTPKRGRPKKEKAEAPKKVTSISKTGAKKTGKSLLEEFTIAKPENRMKGVPVNEIPRCNTFVDDLTESREEYTPKIPLVKRDRPRASKVTRVCGIGPDGKRRDDDGCGKTCLVDPGQEKKLFICEECLIKKAGR